MTRMQRIYADNLLYKIHQKLKARSKQKIRYFYHVILCDSSFILSIAD